MNNPPKNQPRKPNYKLFYFNKDPYCLFLYYSQGHPVNLKQKFPIGIMRIFDDSKMYNRQLISTDHLNTNLQWNHQYFFTLLQEFSKFQIKGRQDPADQTLDFIIRGNVQDGQNAILLKTTLQPNFGIDIHKQFWREFQHYNQCKNQQIQQYEQLSKQNAKNQQRKLQSIKTFCENSQKQKKQLMGRLSAILTQKVNKLKQYEQDYNIQLIQDKFNKARQQQQRKMLSTFQQQAEFGASLFQPSQDFR